MPLSDRAAELPATAGITYLNTGSGPLLAPVATAMTGQVARELADGRAGQAAWEDFRPGGSGCARVSAG